MGCKKGVRCDNKGVRVWIKMLGGYTSMLRDV